MPRGQRSGQIGMRPQAWGSIGHGDDHDRRHWRTRVSRTRGRQQARRARRQRVLARHARRHRGETGAAARRRVREPVVSRHSRQGLADAAARSLRAAGRVSHGAVDHPAADARCRAGFRRLRIVSRRSHGHGSAASRWCCTTPTPSPDSRPACCAYGADRILLGFPDALRGRHAKLVEWVGNPLRDAICALPPPAQRFADRTGPLRLLVVGGSLGAQALNELVPAAVAELDAAQRPSIVHQAGELHIAALRARVCATWRSPPNASPSSTTWRRATRGRTS